MKKRLASVEKQKRLANNVEMVGVQKKAFSSHNRKKVLFRVDYSGRRFVPGYKAMDEKRSEAVEA